MSPADLHETQLEAQLGHRNIYVRTFDIRSLAGLLPDGLPRSSYLPRPCAPEPLRLRCCAGLRRIDHVADRTGAEQVPATGEKPSFPERKYYPSYLKLVLQSCQPFF